MTDHMTHQKITGEEEVDPVAYVLKHKKMGLYLVVGFWCFGDFWLRYTASARGASRFTSRAAYIISSEGIDYHDDGYGSSSYGYIPPDQLEPVYVPEFDPQQSGLPFQETVGELPY